ncbi:MAG: TIGR02757 family protein [Nitrospirae bacterium]|nr:TIGR02757 family protein [Nitrospirota bacterium]
MSELRSVLNRFYREYDFSQRILHDPIEFPHRYKNIGDIEIAGYLACCFAYGRIGLFKPVIEKILSIMGESPYDFLLHFSVARQAKRFQGIQYRFNRNEDIICLLFILKTILRKERSLENIFVKHYRNTDENIGNGLAAMMDRFLSVDTTKIYGRNIKPSGLLQFFPSPAKGSTCKRSTLFLRWMIRDKDIDFGIWKRIPKDKLVIPLDTHIMKISRCLGFTKRNSADWKTAVEITGALKQFDPKDPLKYDFALCHHGVSGICRGERDTTACSGCVFSNC